MVIKCYEINFLNKENVWLKDINGVCITRHIIDPFLKEIKSILQKYVKNFTKIEDNQNKGISAVKIIQEINEKKLHQKILKYIAPYFQLESYNENFTKDKIKKSTKKLLK